ncbi:MAG: thermonuclease family protein [Nanoarchaeota archaeon]|nr:thermonuclease family protein [Nanoarchaeota archaeon]MBU1027852.1 thermonuclease family protein [Nanoarchaeota archaeon]
MKKRNEKILLLFLIFLLIAINYPFLDNALEIFLTNYETGIVERVIDGDTAIINNESVRLLGINSPEKGELYYNEAKEYLEILILNTTVKLKKEKQDTDLYQRKLRYIIIGFTNINREIVKEGLANYYFPSGKDQYYNEFKQAWEECIESNKNLCEKSQDVCSNCIELKKLDYKDQEAILYNRCGFECNLKDWSIKDEGRKKFIFSKINLEPKTELLIKVGEGTNTKNVLFWRGEDYVWTETGDSLFLRDEEGKLVLWKSY